MGRATMRLAVLYEHGSDIKVCLHQVVPPDMYTPEQSACMAKRLWCFLSNETLPLASPTAHTFLARLLKIGSFASTSRTGLLARYVLDLSLLEYGMQWCSASVLAATALYVGMSHGGTSPQIAWPTALEQHTGLSEECLYTCAAELRKLLEVDPGDAKYKHQEPVRAKYRAQVCEGQRLELSAPYVLLSSFSQFLLESGFIA